MEAEKTYIVAGCGYFGCRAVLALKGLSPCPRVIAVDRDEKRLERVKRTADEIRCLDGIEFLAGLRAADAARWWVVPALPLHLAVEWLLRMFNTGRSSAKAVTGASKLPVPEDFAPEGANCHRAPAGTQYCSLSTFKCAEGCPEPEGHCSLTGQQRPMPLYRLLEDTPCPPGYRSLVVRSRLIVPGVGGYPMSDLLAVQEILAAKPGCYLLSTACTCHAVTDAVCIA